MHELGLIVHIAKTVLEVAEENNLSKVSSITLEVGEVSTIVTSYMTDCWEFYKKKFPIFEDSKLKIEIIKGITYCESCQKTYETVEYGKICPYCKSPDTYLIQGSQCNIKEIEAE